MNPYRMPAERPTYEASPPRCLPWSDRWLPLIAAVAAPATFAGALAASAACTPPATAQQAAAEGAYGAALLRCVDEAETLEQSKACRARVDEQWGITQTATDGGAR